MKPKFKHAVVMLGAAAALTLGMQRSLSARGDEPKKGEPGVSNAYIGTTTITTGSSVISAADTAPLAAAEMAQAAQNFWAALTPEQQAERDMLKDAPPTRCQAKYALRTRNLTKLDKIVMHLSYTDAKDVYEHATAEEKRTLLPIMRKKQAEAVRKARGR